MLDVKTVVHGIEMFDSLQMFVTAYKHNNDTLLLDVTGMTTPITSSGLMCRGARLLAVDGRAKLSKTRSHNSSVNQLTECSCDYSFNSTVSNCSFDNSHSV